MALHKCKDCYYGTHSRAYYVEHRITKHQARFVDKETREPLDYSCLKCKKICKGPASLQKHKQRGTCTKPKRHQCPNCLKMFKEAKRRDSHVESYHGDGGKTWKCETCGNELKSLGAHINHQLWHRGLTAQRRARRIRERKLQAKMFRMQQKAIAKRMARERKEAEKDPSKDPSKSAPAKMIPARRSPRIAKKDQKSKTRWKRWKRWQGWKRWKRWQGWKEVKSSCIL